MTLTIGNDRKTKKPGRNARHSSISKSKSKNNIIKGKALIPPAGIAAWYRKELRKLAAEMLRSVSAKVEAAYKGTASDSMAFDESRQERLQRLLDQKRNFRACLSRRRLNYPQKWQQWKKRRPEGQPPQRSTT